MTVRAAWCMSGKIDLKSLKINNKTVTLVVRSACSLSSTARSAHGSLRCGGPPPGIVLLHLIKEQAIQH